MRQLLPVFFFFCSFLSFGQYSVLNQAVSWFGKSDKSTIDSYLKHDNYQFSREKDSLDLHLVMYSLIKTENGTQPVVHLLLSDTSLEFISVDTYGTQGQQAIVPVLKSGRFKSIGTDINGNFITTTYDNGVFLIQEDYEAIPNPLGKGEIAYFRYRIFRKYGKFDTLNGEKIQLSAVGDKIIANYKNGLLDGQRTLYFPNGTIKRTENYRAGRLNGVASDYDTSGRLIHSSTHSYHWKYGMEKWYNNEGKLVKSIQWQRDLPVGTEKQTFNGKIVASIPYVKGIKQGLAKVPVYEEELIDSLNAEPLGIETVPYVDNQKHGKAICMRFQSKDTLYTAFYKAGKLDSTYTWYQQPMYSYYKNVPRFTKTFVNGLEHGNRIYVITEGPLKDSVYQIEPYFEGKLNGVAVRYYDKMEDKLPEFVPGKWIPHYSYETYNMGIPHGPFLIREDSVSYHSGNYVNGQLEGPSEQVMILGEKQVKINGTYENGLKTGTWTTENSTDKVVVTENYRHAKKEGDELHKVNGELVEKRFYHDGMLIHLKMFVQNGNYHSFDIEKSESPDSVLIAYGKKDGDTTTLISYAFSQADFQQKDQMLVHLAAKIVVNPDQNLALNGIMQTMTPQFTATILRKHGKMDGIQVIMHRQTEVMEILFYENGSLRTTKYEMQDSLPYSGIFFSDYANEQIAVKNGLRHGWCIIYDSSKEEVSRTKYVKGVAKKTIARSPLPPPQIN